jgi:hypothetical protein
MHLSKKLEKLAFQMAQNFSVFPLTHTFICMSQCVEKFYTDFTLPVISIISSKGFE